MREKRGQKKIEKSQGLYQEKIKKLQTRYVPTYYLDITLKIYLM